MLAFNGALRPKSLTPDPFFSSVNLLMHFDGSFVDNSSLATSLTTVGTIQTTATNTKFGSACFLGTAQGGLRLTTGLTPYSFGTGSFTIEAWIYLATTFATAGIIAGGRTSITDSTAWLFYVTGINAYFLQNNAANVVIGSMATNSWNHVAVSRTGTSTRLFINGNQAQITTTDTRNYACNELNVGFDGSGTSNGNSLNGRMDELRITKGVCRYAANFTPPTAAFPNF